MARMCYANIFLLVKLSQICNFVVHCIEIICKTKPNFIWNFVFESSGNRCVSVANFAFCKFFFLIFDTTPRQEFRAYFLSIILILIINWFYCTMFFTWRCQHHGLGWIFVAWRLTISVDFHVNPWSSMIIFYVENMPVSYVIQHVNDCDDCHSVGLADAVAGPESHRKPVGSCSAWIGWPWD